MLSVIRPFALLLLLFVPFLGIPKAFAEKSYGNKLPASLLHWCDANLLKNETSYRSYIRAGNIWKSVSRLQADPNTPDIWKEALEILRKKKRSGGLARGIPDKKVESILDHLLNLNEAVRLYGAHFPHIDVEYAMALAIIHDLAEYKAPDFTPNDNMDPAAKFEIENRVMIEFVSIIKKQGYELTATELYKAWIDYETQGSEEAKLVKRLDKVDPVIQSLQYRIDGYDFVSEFYGRGLTVKEIQSDPKLVKIMSWMIETKDLYPKLSPYDRYFTILGLNGDIAAFESYYPPSSPF